MAKISKAIKIAELREELAKLGVSEKELVEWNGCVCNEECFIVDNSWRQRKFGENYHIHIGFKLDCYLDVAEAESFLKWLREKSQPAFKG